LAARGAGPAGSQWPRARRKENAEKIMFTEVLSKCKLVADFGCGVAGSFDWGKIFKEGRVHGFDLVAPVAGEKTPPNMKRQIGDVCDLYVREELKGQFDMIFCEHVYEHVENPRELTASIYHCLRDRGYLHVSIPDSNNFTDRFYHLIFPSGGGHIQQYAHDEFIAGFIEFGFEKIGEGIMGDNWSWFENAYSIIKTTHDARYFGEKEIRYIADVFRKELTLSRGYHYGWEFIFKKVRTSALAEEMIRKAKEQFDVVKLRPLELQSLLPTTVRAGEAFNRQTNGDNAIMIYGHGLSKHTKIILDGVELTSTVVENSISGLVAPSVTAQAGLHTICLEDRHHKRLSNKIEWEIT
jgi:SAM-dependent methyltransferase